MIVHKMFLLHRLGDVMIDRKKCLFHAFSQGPSFPPGESSSWYLVGPESLNVLGSIEIRIYNKKAILRSAARFTRAT
jgi:hypothetical protein